MGYLQDRDRRIASFEETLELCEQDIILSHAIWQTRARTTCYHYEDGMSWRQQLWSRIKKDRTGLPKIRRWRCQANEDNIFVTQERSLEAVRRMKTAYPQSRVAVLHFASGTNPGGGVIRGGGGQEESLCRCSTLYPCLQQHKVRKMFYERHQRTGDPYYSDTCIYLPGIVGIRDDAPGGMLLREQDRYTFDVITCAPPNVRIRKWDEEHKNLMKPLANQENIENVMEQRAGVVIRTAVRNHVDILVLGAFGCGIYGNSPQMVANAFKKALNECEHSFKAIIFAIYSEVGESDNYNAFSAIL